MENQITQNRKAFAYIRVASRVQASPSKSMDDQAEKIRAYCATHDLTLDDADVKRCLGGGINVRGRRSVTVMVDKIRSIGLKHVVFSSLDRFSRDSSDFSFLEDFISTSDVTVHFIKEELILDRQLVKKYSRSAPMRLKSVLYGILLENTFKQFDEERDRALSARIATGLKMRAESGWFPGHPPLGYEVKREISNTGRLRSIVCISPNASVVNRIRREFTLAAQGISLSAIQERMVLEGFIPRSKQTRWELQSLRRRLLNPFYLGRFKWAGTEYQGNHELIPDVAEAARVIQNQEVEQ